MTISFDFSVEDVTRLAKSFSGWGSTVPHQPSNLKKLALWRLILSQCSVEDRARLATHEALFNTAVGFIPSTSSSTSRGRPLDWDRLADEGQTDHAALLAEEAQWMQAGLIHRRTWSSAEWPAVALIEACIQTNTPLPNLDAALWAQVEQKNPGVLEALLPMADGLDWEAFLSVPLKNYSPPMTRASLVVSGEASAIGDLLSPFLTSDIVAGIDAARGGLFHTRLLPADQVGTWVARGAQANARDGRGRLAEETWCHLPVADVLALHNALGAHRTDQENAEALERTCWNLLVRHPWDTLVSEGVIPYLLKHRPEGLASPAAFVMEVLNKDQGSIEDCSITAKNWARICKEVGQGSAEGAQWEMALGGRNAIHGVALGMAVSLGEYFRSYSVFKDMQVANGEEALLVCFEHTGAKALDKNYALEKASAETWAQQPIHQMERWQPVLAILEAHLVEWMKYDARRRTDTLSDSEVQTGWLKLVNAMAVAKPELMRNPDWAPTLLMSSLIAAEARREKYCELPALVALDQMPKQLDQLPEAREWLAACPEDVVPWMGKYAKGLNALVRQKMLDDRLPAPSPSLPPAPRF